MSWSSVSLIGSTSASHWETVCERALRPRSVLMNQMQSSSQTCSVTAWRADSRCRSRMASQSRWSSKTASDYSTARASVSMMESQRESGLEIETASASTLLKD